MQALGTCDVKTPQLLSFCEDSNIIGTQFYLAYQVKGNVYKVSILNILVYTKQNKSSKLIDKIAKFIGWKFR